MDVFGLMSVISFGIACFGIGYAIGKDIKNTQK